MRMQVSILMADEPAPEVFYTTEAAYVMFRRDLLNGRGFASMIDENNVEMIMNPALIACIAAKPA